MQDDDQGEAMVDSFSTASRFRAQALLQLVVQGVLPSLGDPEEAQSYRARAARAEAALAKSSAKAQGGPAAQLMASALVLETSGVVV